MFQSSRVAPHRPVRRLLAVALGLFCGCLWLGLSFGSPKVQAEDCGAQDVECLTRQIEEYKNKISQLRGEQQTLASTIAFLNSKVVLTEKEIQRTQAQITVLQQEIGELSVRIAGLELSLKQISTQLVARIRSAYMDSYRFPSITALFASGFSEYVTQRKYSQLSQKYTEEILKQAETQRLEFSGQKELREQKQKEMQALQTKLSRQRDLLSQQQADKKKVLAVTKNDEKKYQELLATAEAQKRAFNRFVNTQGGASILSGQTKCDSWGCYYNQRDSSWGRMTVGNSNETLNRIGCLISSMAMVATHYGKKLTPADIASSTDPFYLSTALMVSGSWTVNGVTATRTRVAFSTQRVDEELNAGRPVIVGLYGGPDHFLVLKGKSDKGYIMNDPFPENGNDKVFTDRYRLSDISTLDIVRF